MNLDLDKALPLARYAGEAPPIILDNIIEEENIRINASAVLHKGPSNDMRVLTCYLDRSSGKWVEASRASHPFISINVTKINPHQNNKKESDTKKLCLMADSGAMCTLLNFETVKSMGIVPESLETSQVSITSVNGKLLQSQTRQMHTKIVNPRNKAESWERVYVSPKVEISLVSKDCLIRLGIIDPKQFLSDTEVRS